MTVQYSNDYVSMERFIGGQMSFINMYSAWTYNCKAQYVETMNSGLVNMSAGGGGGYVVKDILRPDSYNSSCCTDSTPYTNFNIT
jgi:hypothetical protein